MVKKLFDYKKEDSLIRDSFILFIATMFANLAAFFYHFYMGRVLGPADYGILGAILSIAYIVSVPSIVIQTTLTKFIADLKAKKKDKDINLLYKTALSKFFLFSILIFVLFLSLSHFLAGFLKIDTLTLIVFSPVLIFAFLLPVTRGLLQGKQEFKKLGFNLFLEAFSKLVLGILLVYMGFHIYGAIAGIVLSFTVAFFYLHLGNIKIKTENKFEMSNIYKFGIPVLLSLLILTLFYTIDVFLVKHYFSELEAGYYAAISLIGKIVFFASAAISTVMFPKVAELYARKKPTIQILYKSMFFVSIIGVFIIACYLLFPKLIVSILLGNAFIEIASYLWMFGIVMLFFSLTYLLVFYNLSVNRKSFLPYLLFVLIVEIVVIFFYHVSLKTIIFELILLNLLSLILMLIYTLRRK